MNITEAQPNKANEDIISGGKEKESLMKVQLLGVMGVNFTNNSGETINGTNLFVVFENPDVDGLMADRFFVKAGIPIPKDTKINDFLDISFNHKGKIESIRKA